MMGEISQDRICRSCESRTKYSVKNEINGPADLTEHILSDRRRISVYTKTYGPVTPKILIKTKTIIQITLMSDNIL